MNIHLGYQVGTGKAVEVPLKHLVCVGQTQESGKTTTLEALVARAEVPAIAFVTKRGEGSFANGRRIQPYFRDRADWQFVDQLLEAQLREKNKFLRPWIIRICRSTKTLADVQQAVWLGLKKAKGISQGVYTQLDAYLDLIVPEIRRAPLARRIELAAGLNVMDVADYPAAMQMLFVQSAIDWVNAHERKTVVIIPEAWEFIPETRGSPVKASAVALVRKGAALGNYLWADSQDTAGVSKEILRGCAVWLIGVQREANEIKRNLANIPAGIAKPKAGDIATLERGQFFACWKDQAIKTYVQPAWMEDEDAIDIARERLPAPPRPSEEDATSISLGEKDLPKPSEDYSKNYTEGDTEVTKQEAERLEAENRELRRRVDQLERRLAESKQAEESSESSPEREPLPASSVDGILDEGTYQLLKQRLLKDDQILRVLKARPELRVEAQRQILTIDSRSPEGWIATLISEGFFEDIAAGNAVFVELKKRGAKLAKPGAYEWCRRLVKRGFLTEERKGGFRVVPGMKVNIVEK